MTAIKKASSDSHDDFIILVNNDVQVLDANNLIGAATPMPKRKFDLYNERRLDREGSERQL